MTSTRVYRIQPIESELHAVETIDSNDEACGGVHVYGSIGEIAGCRFWCAPEYDHGCELAVIECGPRDLKDSGDAEGYVLAAGRGRIVERIQFANLRAVADWAAENE